MKRLWSEGIRDLSPYVPGEQPPKTSIIKLNTNENPYPPSPAVLNAIKNASNADLRLYPDPEGTSLKYAIASVYNINTDNVFLGNGSDEVLAHTFLALLNHRLPILFPDITYSFYPVYCSLYKISYEEIPLGPKFQVIVEEFVRPNGGIVLPNPNAPTGCAVSLRQLRHLLECCPDSVLVVDEAYVDFGADSAASLIQDYPNLLIIQTLSKSRSLAGLRVGYALGDSNLVNALNTVKGCFNSYPLDRLALAGAEAAIWDHQYYQETRAKIIESREWLTKELQALAFFVLPSQANFIFARHPSISAETLQHRLRRANIVVRRFTKARISDFLRITVGTFEECQELVCRLHQIEAEEK